MPLEAPTEAAKDRSSDEKVKIIMGKMARPQYSSRQQRHQNELIEVPTSLADKEILFFSICRRQKGEYDVLSASEITELGFLLAFAGEHRNFAVVSAYKAAS